MNGCPSLNDNGTCRVATAIAGCPAAASQAACVVCLARDDTGQPNAVTVSLALAAVRGTPAAAGVMAAYGHKLRRIEIDSAALREITSGSGVGSQLWRLLGSLSVQHTASCSCLDLARRMNDLGPVGCRAERAQLVTQMRVNAASYGWSVAGKAAVKAIASGLAWRLNPTDLYGSLLDEAIRRAENELPADPIDILLPLGPGSQYGNLELRLALRAIEQHAVGLRQVVVVGTIPSWLRETDRVRIVPVSEYKANKASRISLKVLWSFEHLALTDRVAFWNDDYLMLRPFDIRGIPTFFRGKLWRKTKDHWSQLLDHTGAVLRQAGLPVRHFDIHIPVLFDRDKFLALSPWWQRSRQDKLGFVMKSIYGNHYCRGDAGTTIGTPEDAISAHDCKLKADWQQRIKAVAGRRWVISYGDAALQNGLADWMQGRFPNPSEAERAEARVCCR